MTATAQQKSASMRWYADHKHERNAKRRRQYAEAQQVEMFPEPEPATTRPADGPRCKHPGCNKVLIPPYETARGECFSHTQAHLHAWHYETVTATAEQAA